jgi:hypothetical protein
MNFEQFLQRKNEMKKIGLALGIVMASGLIAAPSISLGHGTESGQGPAGMMVTRHFTGIWDQVDHESQGIALQVIEQLDDSRKAVGYWYTYGADRKTAWYMGIGLLIDNRIEFELYDSTDVGFLQPDVPGNDSVQSIGTMTIEFDSCQNGDVTYQTTQDEVGSGSFSIERILEVMNTHCTGGISDDMHTDAMFGEQRLELSSAREGINGNGHARYEDFPAHMEFEVEVEDMPDGSYHLYLGQHDRGDFEVMNGRGEIRFSSPAEDGHMLMNFDPRGMMVEVHDASGAVLSSFDGQFEQDEHQHHDGGHNGDHDYGCGSGGMGGGHGGGMGGGHGGAECVDDGDFIEVEIDLDNTGVLADADGEAEWELNSHRVKFSVEIEDVPVGNYPLHVGGSEVGVIEAFEMHNGEVFGHISFRDPEVYGMEHLDFDPRGQKIEVLQGEAVILEVDFPVEQ